MGKKDFLLGKFVPEKRDSFVSFGNNSAEPHYLLKDVYDAFILMKKQATTEGIDLNIISSTRIFERQKAIWENKWSGKTAVSGFSAELFQSLPGIEKTKAIMLYSAMPGTSRHHWGTDFDLNSVEPEFFLTHEGMKIYYWLNKNARRFGFFQPYTSKGKDRPFGYEEEAWHWSYYPISNEILLEYNQLISYADIQGFSGVEFAAELKVIENYVNGIAKI
jgi:D-alanyl-D-alanine carboxypeptidase